LIKTHLAAGVLAFGVATATSTAAADCKMFQVAELPVRLERNKLIVDGEINSRKIGIVLDTGATSTMIFRSAAERLGLRRDRARGVRMFGVGGETTVESALVDEIKIGNASRKNWRMLVGGEHEIGAGMDVLLGEDFLQSFDVEFDLKRAAVRLYQPKDCAGVSLAYWATDGPRQVEFEPVDETHPQIRLSVLINGQTLRALFDSGASISLLDSPAAARLGVTPDTPGVVQVGRGAGLGRKTVDYWIGEFQSIAIGDETINDTSIVFGALFKDASYTKTGSRVPIRVESVSMLLGADFLRAHRVLVAHSQRTIYFTYVGGPVFQRTAPPASSTEPSGEAEAGPADGAR
jgi:clan AA aspartic protease (TIGR02281 family)